LFRLVFFDPPCGFAACWLEFAGEAIGIWLRWNWGLPGAFNEKNSMFQACYWSASNLKTLRRIGVRLWASSWVTFFIEGGGGGPGYGNDGWWWRRVGIKVERIISTSGRIRIRILQIWRRVFDIHTD
jgi:hypothetical protein